MYKKVLLFGKDNISESLVTCEKDLGFLLKDSDKDDIILGWIELVNGLTLVCNYGDSDPDKQFKNTLVSRLFGYDLNNTVALCRYNDSEILDEIIDLTDEDLIEMEWRLHETLQRG